MKKLTIILLIFASATIARAQSEDTIVIPPIVVTYTLPASQAKLLHEKTSNEFASKIGKALKHYYPACISLDEECDITIENVSDSLRLTFEGTIERTEPANAQYYFEHAGTLFVGTDLPYTQRLARNNTLAQFNALSDKFVKAYGDGCIARTRKNLEVAILVGYNWYCWNESWIAVKGHP